MGSQQWFLVPLQHYGMGQPCSCCTEIDGPIQVPRSSLLCAAQICAGGTVGCALSWYHHQPSPRALFCISPVLGCLEREGCLCAVLLWALIFPLLFVL